MINGSCHHPARDECLSKTHLIRDEKSLRWVWAIKPFKNIIHSRALKILQAGKHSVSVGLGTHFAIASRAVSQIGFHTF
jgi:hypothetical protein